MPAMRQVLLMRGQQRRGGHDEPGEHQRIRKNIVGCQ